MKKKTKRKICLILASIFAITLVSSTVKAESFNRWTNDNIYAGTTEASKLAQKADIKNIAYILSEAFGLNDYTPIDIKDINSSSMYYKHLCACINAGVMDLTEGRSFADETVKRKEIPEFFKWLNLTASNSFDEFCEAGYIKAIGSEYEENRPATIDDFVFVLNSVYSNQSKLIRMNETIDSSYVLKDKTRLQNVTVNGNLYICISSKTILENVFVNGNIYIVSNNTDEMLKLINCTCKGLNLKAKNKILAEIVDCDIKNIEYSAPEISTVVECTSP